MLGNPCIYILTFGLCIGCSFAAESQDKTTDAIPAKSPQQDFGKGFAMLFQMGLPRVDGAMPALIDISNGPVSISNYRLNSDRNQIVAWIKKSDKSTEPATCIIGGAFECKLYNQSVLTKMQYEKDRIDSAKIHDGHQMDNALPPVQDYFSGEWRKITSAKIAEDIKRLLPDKDDEYGKVQKSRYGLLLLQAAQLYQSGAKSEANEVTALLFKAGDSKEVLQSALNVLADAEYLRAYCNLIESRDWGKFNTDLDKITGKFKNNWAALRYAKAIQAMVAARIKNPEPPELKSTIPLSADDLKLVAQLSEITQADYDNNESAFRYRIDCWLFPKSETDADTHQKTLNVLDKIRNRGIKSVPLLMAMLDDEWMLFCKDRGLSRSMYGVEAGSNDSEQNDESNRDATLSETAGYLDIPITRGQLARKLLEPLIIQESKEPNDISGMNIEQFKVRCLAWYESIKKLDAKELQKKYLNDGGYSQKDAALESMIAVVDDITAPLIENALIETGIHTYNEERLIKYCEIRKDKAQSFIEKLRREFYQQLDKQYNEQNRANPEWMPSKEKEKADLDRFFAQLNQSKSAVPLTYSMEEVVKEMLAATSDEEFRFVADKFIKAAKGSSPEKICQICLDAAVQAKNPKQKLFLLCLLQMSYDNKLKIMLDINRFKLQLEKLLFDESEPCGERAIPLNIATMIEHASEGEPVNGIYIPCTEEESAFYTSWDEKYEQYLIRRAKAILNGTPADKLPNLINVEELKGAQIAEAKSKIAGKSENEIKEFCRQAQLEELMPLSVVLRQDKQLNSRLLSMANQITEVNTEIPELKDKVAKFKDKALNEQILHEIIQLAENRIQNGRMVEFSLRRRCGFQGVVLKFERSDYRKGNAISAISSKRGMGAYFSLDNLTCDVHWTVTLISKPQEQDLDKVLTEDRNIGSETKEFRIEQEKKFTEAFTEAFLKNGNALLSGQIIMNDTDF